MNWLRNPMDVLKDFMKTPMIQLLETIQENVMHKLPYYDDFKKAYQEKEERPLKTYSAKPITEDQKKDINELIKTNKFLFGYRNDIKSIGVLTNIIEYSTFCGDPVEMAIRKFGKTGYLMLPVKSKIEHFKDKISQIMHYFYYHPDITREIGAALEKYVDVPNRHRTNSEDIFDYNYSQGDSIIFNKNGIRTVGAIQKKHKKQYQVDYIDYKDKKPEIKEVTLRENDILGYGNNKGGIISWIFTDVVIDDFTKACHDPKYDGNRESKKCEQGTPLNMRNNVICTLYEGAKTANPNTQYPEIKMCTDCKEEDNMSDNYTDQESISSRGSRGSEDLANDPAPVSENRASSFSSYRSSSNRYSEDIRTPVFEDRPSLSSDTSNTTLTDEESKAYEKFKEAVCKASLEEKESELYMKNIAEISAEKNRSKNALKEKDDEIKQLKIDLNKQGRRVLPNIFNRKQWKDNVSRSKGGKKKSSTKKKRKNVTRRKKKYGKKSKKSRK